MIHNYFDFREFSLLWNKPLYYNNFKYLEIKRKDINEKKNTVHVSKHTINGIVVGEFLRKLKITFIR